MSKKKLAKIRKKYYIHLKKKKQNPKWIMLKTILRIDEVLVFQGLPFFTYFKLHLELGMGRVRNCFSHEPSESSLVVESGAI